MTERTSSVPLDLGGEDRYRLLVDAIIDHAVYMLDAEGRVASWNQGAQRIKGYRPEEIIGGHFSRFYTPEDRAAGLPQQSLETARREGRFEKEGWRVRKDGSRFWAHVVIEVIRDGSGQIAGFAKVTRDITERREAQIALDQTREALFQAQKMEAIGQLTGGIAHDFNNLLMAIMGSLELLGKRLPPDDAKAEALLDNALQGARRGASLTQRMLAFARRQELRREAVDLPGLVEGMRGLLDRSLGPSFEIATRFADGLPPAETDPTQLEAALLNLAVNARDAMPEGGTITIRAEPVRAEAGQIGDLAAGDYVRLSVADTGEGMDAAALARATEPFFTTKGVGKGTGLGLSMVLGLAQQSGGALRLKSAPGRGTTVELWLPVAQARDVREAATVVPPPRTIQPLRVLAVDDDDLVLRNTAAMLEDLGHDAVAAASAEEALAILRRGTDIDIVITDQAMPRMTGAQLVETLHAEWPKLPVILATGFAELPGGPVASTLRLSKPFTQRELALGLAAAAHATTH